MKNSPGRRNVVPYTISAAVEDVSSFSAVRMPRRVSGKASIHEEELGWPSEQPSAGDGISRLYHSIGGGRQLYELVLIPGESSVYAIT